MEIQLGQGGGRPCVSLVRKNKQELGQSGLECCTMRTASTVWRPIFPFPGVTVRFGRRRVGEINKVEGKAKWNVSVGFFSQLFPWKITQKDESPCAPSLWTTRFEEETRP